MVTKLINSNKLTVKCTECGHRGYINIPAIKHGQDYEIDSAFGQPMMIITTPDDDTKRNIDLYIGQLPVSYRTRDLKLTKYNEISIRNERKNGIKTERAKILDGECESLVYIFDFHDCFVICRLQDIFDCLKNDVGYVVPNHDKKTSGYYIDITKLQHLVVPKVPSAQSPNKSGG